MTKYLFGTLRTFIPLAVAITIMAGLVYWTVQQDLRQTTNDELVQIALDFTNQLSQGTSVGSFDPSVQSDIETSLAPFVLIYDAQGHPLTGSGLLDGSVPSLPAGVFDYAKDHSEDRFTWQPKDDIREAMVVRYYTSSSSSGFVAVGHSLQETERHENKLGWQILIGWLIALVASFIATALMEIIATSVGKSDRSE
ncbi:MAG TPA: hypothetical protein VFK07_03345 [Candidatus Paceibacterota bacterium]|nr:hypothetical protein [Candidatus Paceibacterota bacterium]